MASPVIFDFSVGMVKSRTTGSSPFSFTGRRKTLIPSLDEKEYALSVVEQEERTRREDNRIRKNFFITTPKMKETSQKEAPSSKPNYSPVTTVVTLDQRK